MMKYVIVNGRCVALSDFGDVSVGDKGGFLDGEHNLSQIGSCWIYDRAQVRQAACLYDNARVYDTVKVSGRARIFENARIFDETVIIDNVQVGGDARILGQTKLTGDQVVIGNREIYKTNGKDHKKQKSNLRELQQLRKNLQSVTIVDKTKTQRKR